MTSNKINYPVLLDNKFGIQAHAAILKRSVEYCQWLEEGFDSVDKLTRTRRYMKVWVKEIINSSEFMDIRYHNPPFKLPFSSDYIFSEFIPFGNYKINSSIYKKNKNDFIPFKLDGNHGTILSKFNSSFKYISNGQFYYSHNKQSNDLILPHKNNDNCVPGDIRISIFQYSPHEISVAGYLNSKTRIINTYITNKFEIGALEAGNITLKNLLLIRYKKMINITAVLRFLACFMTLFYIMFHSATQIEAIFKFIITSLAVFFFKLLIWNGKYIIGFCFQLSFVFLFICLKL